MNAASNVDFKAKIEIIKAEREDFSIILNLARFYVYDISKYCGITESSFNWSFPEDGLYDCSYFSKYMNDPTCFSFILRINGELGGFVIVNKEGISPDTDWNMSQFFVVAKFQGQGIGRQVAANIFEKFHGAWEVSQLPSNKPAIAFWNKIIDGFTHGRYSQSTDRILDAESCDKNVFRFKTQDLQ